MKIIEATELVKKYGSAEAEVKALDRVSLEVDEGERIVITGTSGSGKSTLLNVLSALDCPDEGSVQIIGQDLYRLSRSEQAVFRRRNIGFVFQDFQLMPTLTVEENIILPQLLDNSNVDEEYLELLLKKLGLGEKRKNYPGQLSGGQQQRAAIGRALIMRPAIILADEPTGNLDRKNSDEVLQLMQEASESFCQTILIITHDESVKEYATRCLEMEDGILR